MIIREGWPIVDKHKVSRGITAAGRRWRWTVHKQFTTGYQLRHCPAQISKQAEL